MCGIISLFSHLIPVSHIKKSPVVGLEIVIFGFNCMGGLFIIALMWLILLNFTFYCVLFSIHLSICKKNTTRIKFKCLFFNITPIFCTISEILPAYHIELSKLVRTIPCIQLYTQHKIHKPLVPFSTEGTLILTLFS